MLSDRRLAAAFAGALLVPLALPSSPSTPASASPSVVDEKAIYMEHCAQCHGETGDGKGTTDLERPARSFLDGGYSYGNTRKAVLRSVVHGIPGTPMPAFAETLNGEQLQAVADYVIALGPPGTIVRPGDSVMEVGEQPVVVQGMMPAYREGGFREPRSVVVGFPNGTTFQYRKQDARLIAVRQGDFLDRKDWGGRGGQALKPLGALTWSTNDAYERANDVVDAKTGEALTRRITGTRIEGDSVWLSFDLAGPDGPDGSVSSLGGGHEIIRFVMVDDVPVAVRAIVAVSGTRDVRMRPIGSDGFATLVGTVDTKGTTGFFDVRAVSDGVFAVEQPDLPGLRFFVHASAWSDRLSTALIRSLIEND
ncbi:MAG: c-type cytochrome [Planctomycetota bacterium]